MRKGGDGGDSTPRWARRWQRPAPALVELSLSPDGQTVAWMDDRGRVRRLDSVSGRQLWRTAPMAGIDGLAAAPGGQVLVWKRFAAVRPEVLVLNAVTGSIGARQQRVTGAIWSVAISPSGDAFFVGTGDHSVTRYPLGGAREPPRGLRVEGYPESLALGPNDMVVCGTWLPSGVSGPGGWRYRESDPARWFDVQLCADGSTLAALSFRGPRRSNKVTEARLLAWDMASGKRLFERPINGSALRLRLSEDGSVIALSYVAVAHYATGDVSERRLALFARDGRRIAPERGGSYLAPELVALSASGNRITVLDMDRSLCTLDRTGRTVARLPLPLDPATQQPYSIRSVHSSADGQVLLMYRGDANLVLYTATAE